jgi:uncharacterized membrane protein
MNRPDGFRFQLFRQSLLSDTFSVLMGFIVVEGGRRVENKRSVSATLAAVFAALYAVGVLVLAPISFQAFQVRVADALLPLTILFGWPAIIGLALGALVANMFGGLGPIDILGGSLANLVAGYVAWRVALNRGRSWIFVAVGLQVLIVTLTVGTYLSYLFAMPLEIGWLGVMIGSIVAIGFLGSLLLHATSSQRIVMLLTGHGISIYAHQTGGQKHATAE